jgi:aldehyde dehydrogenase (NAD+)
LGRHIVGKKISVAAAQSNLKRVTLELGGKGPAIVFEGMCKTCLCPVYPCRLTAKSLDADIERAARTCAASIARNSGQICSTQSRVYVHESIYPKFIEIYKASYIELAKHGDPSDSATTQGPLVDAAQFKRVLDYIETGKLEGKLLTGGKRKEGTAGYFVEPTIFTDVPDNARINTEEIFGPVSCIDSFRSCLVYSCDLPRFQVSVVHTFKTEPEAIRRANDT